MRRNWMCVSVCLYICVNDFNRYRKITIRVNNIISPNRWQCVESKKILLCSTSKKSWNTPYSIFTPVLFLFHFLHFHLSFSFSLCLSPFRWECLLAFSCIPFISFNHFSSMCMCEYTWKWLLRRRIFISTEKNVQESSQKSALMNLSDFPCQQIPQYNIPKDLIMLQFNTLRSKGTLWCRIYSRCAVEWSMPWYQPRKPHITTSYKITHTTPINSVHSIFI